MLSNSCRYGIRAVIYLAGMPESSGKTGIKKISNDLDLPAPFLAKILQQLAKQKILSSTKGPHGGFSLLKDPGKVTLYDIVTSIDGDGIFTNCVMHNSKCPSADKNNKQCPLHDDYAKIRNEQLNLFRGKTIYDLVEKVSYDGLFTI
jgi:Rrf2 family transcriptional regulator, iron-sulfur cluster assembly transcription factor